jgi:hypothetical protein
MNAVDQACGIAAERMFTFFVHREVMIAAAVRNNAMWCDAMCRAHGIAGEADVDAWTWPMRTPPYYPDAVTLRPSATAAALLGRIDSGAGCSIKDSFATLDLPGFKLIVEASWMFRPPAPVGGDEWSVGFASDLPGWERAWGEPLGLFVPALLTHAQFLAARRGGRIVAGAILNRTGDVVGISNLFGGDWAGAVTTASRLYPDLPLVGYAAGDDLAAAHRQGFEVIGPLRVWMRGE